MTCTYGGFGTSLAIRDVVGIGSLEAANPTLRGGTSRTCKRVKAVVLGGFMSSLLVLRRKWIAWYRVLRYGKGFGFVDSVRYGLWLARS